MKKYWSLILALLLALTLTACGSKSECAMPVEGGGVCSTSAFPGENGIPGAETDATADATADATESAPVPVGGVEMDRPAKRIFRGSLELESTAFEDAAAELRALVERCGGYIQSSDLHNYGDGYRTADYTVRVPADRYREFFDGAGAVCHLTWKSEDMEDVSLHYYDTAGRLETQQTKLKRLQELLGKAENVADIITIQSAISDTEYQIDALSGELRHYDDQVDYSTVTITLREVYRLSNDQAPAETFGERMSIAFTGGLRSFGSAMENLVVALAYSWVWLLVAAAVVVVVILVVRRRVRRPAEERRPLFRRSKKQDGPDA